MTTSLLTPPSPRPARTPPRSRPVASLRRTLRWHPPLMAFAVAMAGLTAVTLAGLAFDDRVLLGDPIWLKPFKFAVSLAVYAVTLAWMISMLARGRRVAWWAGTIAALAGAGEIAIIVAQVIRGRRSHFNNATPLDERLFALMGQTIAVLWLATLVVGILLMMQRVGDAPTTWSIRLGVLISLVGMGLGMLMVLPTAEQRAAGIEDVQGAHSVGVPDGGPGMAVTGWSTTGGDLRIPHFVGLHALQLLPLLAIALAALAARLPRLRDERVRARLVVIAAGSYVGLVALVTWQALRGQPLVAPDGTTLAAAGILVAATAAAVVVVLRRRPPTRRPVVQTEVYG